MPMKKTLLLHTQLPAPTLVQPKASSKEVVSPPRAPTTSLLPAATSDASSPPPTPAALPNLCLQAVISTITAPKQGQGIPPSLTPGAAPAAPQGGLSSLLGAGPHAKGTRARSTRRGKDFMAEGSHH